MELTELGLTEWFQKKFDNINQPGHSLARISAVDKEKYLVVCEKGELQAEIIGKLRFEAQSGLDFPTIGDWVSVQYFNNDSLAIIHGILPRKSVLKRKTAGKNVDFQLLAANIDIACIMQSLDLNFNVRRLERYLVMVHDGGIEPVILLSKCDLLSPEEVQEKIAEIKKLHHGYRVIAFSNNTGEGLDQVHGLITPGSTYCLLGSSGVGKTSLINRLTGNTAYATQEVREKDRRGRHTTTRRQLMILPDGGLLIDTPGMRELGTIAVDTGISETFSEIVALTGNCRFVDCTHTSEPGCAVLEAVESELISPELYASYMKLRKESAYHAMSYLEKRKRDKKFGKMVKDVMKNYKKG